MKRNNLIGYKLIKSELIELCNECIEMDEKDLRHNYDLLVLKAGEYFEQELYNLYVKYIEKGLPKNIIVFVFNSIINNRFFDTVLYKGDFRGYLSIKNELLFYTTNKYHY